MKCLDPFVTAGQAFPCGKCLPCLARWRAVWQHRIMLETLCHSDNAFVTLTYADDTLPADLSLDPATLQRFLKRLRVRLNYKVRYYAVGEYGDQSERPHYHLVLFGYATCLKGRSVYRRGRDHCCSQCDQIRVAWGLGNVSLGTVTTQSVGYVCGYMTKNMRRTDDVRLKGRWPEFARMSLKPGIGADALWEVADVDMRYGITDREGDVQVGLRHGGTIRPYGRYLRRKLREMVGRDVKAPPFEDEELRAMREAARGDQENPSVKARIRESSLQRDAKIRFNMGLSKGRKVL